MLYISARIKHTYDMADMPQPNRKGVDPIGSVNSNVCVDSGNVVASSSYSFVSSISVIGAKCEYGAQY